MHQFGYHLAKKILGESQVNSFIRRAYENELQNPKQNQLHAYRANWRSNARYPWDLPTCSSSISNGMAAGAGDINSEENINTQALFVDITFDFLIFPTEIVSEGRTYCCHVLKKEAFWGEDVTTFQGKNMEDEANSIAMSVAIRIGALIALPSSQCNDDIESSSGNKRDLHGDFKPGDNGYQYYYQRGNNALTVADLDLHCNRIDIIRESMDSEDVARIVGGSFLDESNSNTIWQVSAKREKKNGLPSSGSTGGLNNLTTIDGSNNNDQTEKQLSLTCHLKLHDKSFNADGSLPLSSNGTGTSNSTSASVDQSMLDMMILQSNAANSESNIVSVPKTEALFLWNAINPSIVKALEKPIEPSPQKMSPAREVAAAAATNPYAQKASPKKEEAEAEEPIKRIIKKPPRPAEQHLFAKGKKTTLGGGRKKKSKFRMGDA